MARSQATTCEISSIDTFSRCNEGSSLVPFTLSFFSSSSSNSIQSRSSKVDC